MRSRESACVFGTITAGLEVGSTVLPYQRDGEVRSKPQPAAVVRRVFWCCLLVVVWSSVFLFGLGFFSVEKNGSRRVVVLRVARREASRGFYPLRPRDLITRTSPMGLPSQPITCLQNELNQI